MSAMYRNNNGNMYSIFLFPTVSFFVIPQWQKKLLLFLYMEDILPF